MVMKFADLDLSQEYSYADYLKWTFKERLEIIKGKIFKMSPAASPPHQRLSLAICRELAIFLKGRPCRVYAAPFDVRLPRLSKKYDKIDTVVQPDLCVICDPGMVDRRGCVAAPDIVVEIVSPSSRHRDLTHKFQVYEEAGVKEYWVFMPNEKVCLVHKHNYGGHFFTCWPLSAGEILETPILPGFELDLGEAFREMGDAGEGWTENRECPDPDEIFQPM
jgi:Uma2 family endonuclease